MHHNEVTTAKGSNRLGLRGAYILGVLVCVNISLLLLTRGISWFSKPSTSIGPSAGQQVAAIVGLYYYAALLVIGIVFVGHLFTGRFGSALPYAIACFILYYTLHLAGIIRGDFYESEYYSHQRIRNAFFDDRIKFFESINVTKEELRQIKEPCIERFGCWCYVLAAKQATKDFELDLGAWHKPKSSFFDTGFKTRFAIISVARIDKENYSILACDLNYWALRPA
jgi:hypothetical protein